MLLARWSNIYHCFLENVQAPIYEKLLLVKCRAFWTFRAHHHLYDLMISLVLQTAWSYPRILLIVTTTMLLKTLEESWALKVTKLANVISQYFK